VSQVIAAQTAQPPRLLRAPRAEPHHDEILELYSTCQGNLVRVHEELLAQGVEISYPALTAFCRRHGIGTKPKTPAGRYHFEPGPLTLGRSRPLVFSRSRPHSDPDSCCHSSPRRQ
jgi:hypothetical protein